MTREELKQYRSIAAEIKELEKHTDTMHWEPILKNCRARKKEIEDFVNNISDSETRQIFRYRYIYGRHRMSWQYIAYKIGKTDESYPRRKHKEYLERNGL